MRLHSASQDVRDIEPFTSMKTSGEPSNLRQRRVLRYDDDDDEDVPKQLLPGILKVKNNVQALKRSSNDENTPKNVKFFPKFVTSPAQQPLIPINQNRDPRRTVQLLISSSGAPKTLNQTSRFEQQNSDGINPTVAVKNILHNKILMDQSRVNKMKEKIESLEATVSTLKGELGYVTTIMDQMRNLSTVFHRLKAAACIWVFALFSERLKINFINPNKSRTQIQAAAFI